MEICQYTATLQDAAVYQRIPLPTAPCSAGSAQWNPLVQWGVCWGGGGWRKASEMGEGGGMTILIAQTDVTLLKLQ